MPRELLLPLFLSVAMAGAIRAGEFSAHYPDPLRPSPVGLPSDRHAVAYQLRGVITVHPEGIVLNTEDGRVFTLEMDAEEAASWEGKPVEVRGKAEAGDEVENIRVRSVTAYDPSAPVPELPPHKSKFRQAVFEGEADGAIKVSNMRWLEPAATSHNFSWTSAVIRPEMIKDIYFVTKVQPPGLAGHSLLFFEFEDGGFAAADGRKSRGFYLSVEAYAREGENYSLLAGFRKTYGIIWLLTNFEDYSMYSAFDKDWMHFNPVLTDKAGKIKMTRDTLEQATKNREGEWYHTTRNNCTNNLVLMINHSLPRERRAKMWIIPHLIYNIYSSTPPMVPAYLINKGVLGPTAFTLDPENFREFIPLPQEPPAADKPSPENGAAQP